MPEISAQHTPWAFLIKIILKLAWNPVGMLSEPFKRTQNSHLLER